MVDQAGLSDDGTLQSFLEETYRDYEDTQQELKEIDVLIKQSAAEVERLAQRNTQVVNFIRQLQANFDTVPRNDIREGYEALQNSQQRLFTMRGQLEKLQSDQRNLERLADLQRRLIGLSESLGAMPIAPRGDRKGWDQANVVRIIQTQETERQSLVRKMHDGPASSLSNFILQAEICRRYFDINPDRARAELAALENAATATFSAVKDFIFDLRPMMLDDLGLVPTLRRYTESLQEKGNMPVSIVVTGVERRLESHVEVTIFRAVQELLTNAREHAQATQVQVLLDMGDNRVTAIVEDNGSGFNVDEALSGGTRETIGLASLRERVEMIDGTLDVHSSLGQGTRAEISVPVEPEAA